MTKTHPTTPSGSENSAVFISTGDGAQVNMQALELQALFEIRGKFYADLVYLLGAGKTLLNMRSEKAPQAFINGILDGGEISPAGDNKAAVSRLIIEVDGIIHSVAAVPDLALSNATANRCWNAIVVDESSKTISVVKGTDGATLLDTFGDAAGQRPMIPIGKLLIGWAEVGTADYTLQPGDVDYLYKEFGGVEVEYLSNHGGVKLQKAMPKIHASTIGGEGAGRPVKMSCFYLDDVMSEIGSAKDWNWSSNANSTSEATFKGAYSTSRVAGFTVTFSQLSNDKKVIDVVLKREGACAIRWLYPNGFGYQSAATLTFNEVNPQTGFINRNVTVPLLDFPVEYTGD